IAIEAVEMGAGVEPGTLAATRAWEELSEAGLVKLDGDGRAAALHRLLHRRLTITLSERVRAARAAAMAVVVRAWLFMAVDGGRIALVEPQVPHVEAVLAAAEGRGDQRVWIDIAHKLGEHLSYRGAYAAARALFQRALDAAEHLDAPGEGWVGR